MMEIFLLLIKFQCDDCRQLPSVELWELELVFHFVQIHAWRPFYARENWYSPIKEAQRCCSGYISFVYLIHVL